MKFHSSIKPFLETYQISIDTTNKPSLNKWKKKIFEESLLSVNEDQ